MAYLRKVTQGKRKLHTEIVLKTVFERQAARQIGYLGGKVYHTSPEKILQDIEQRARDIRREWNKAGRPPLPKVD